MGDRFFDTLVTIAGGIVVVAIVALIVSKKAQAPQVIQAAGTAYSSALAVAVSPVTGAVPQANLTYPSDGGIGNIGGFTPNLDSAFG